jgi:hypothetical protein
MSFNALIGVIDWLGRWDWLKAFMLVHPHIAHFLQTPFASLSLLAVGLLVLWAERRIKQPEIRARYTNFRATPDLHSATMKMLFDAEKKRPGWDEHRFDWDWFIEVQMVNDSETRATFDDLKVEVSTGLLWNKRVFQVQHLEDLDSFDMDMLLDGTGKGHGRRVVGERYRPIPSLMEKIKDIPLEQEIGHRGWLHFKIFQANQREMNNRNIRINIWILDAGQREHKLSFKKKDEKSWDKNFYIGRKVTTV